MRGFLPPAARLFGIAGAISCAVLSGIRCAHVEPPSGGPVDATPPRVAAVYPPPDAANVPGDARVIFQFTEWVDRNGSRNQVMVSPPFPGKARVETDGDRLKVSPPAGRRLRENTTYEVTVLGTFPDLRGNPMGAPFTLRFSTGAALDSASVAGVLGMDGRRGNLVAALYHAGDRDGAAAGIEALSPRDTAFRPAPVPEPWRELPAFLAAADSAGRFRFGAAAGDYALFAFEDLNGNFAFDPGFEAAAAGDLRLSLRPRAADQTLRLVAQDTAPLRVTEAAFEADPAPGDSAGTFLRGAVRVKFSHPPHPARAAEAARYRVLPDSGEELPVSGAGWSPDRQAWILETPPLRANARHRVEVRGRPDFPGRAGAGENDTSAIFVAEASGTPPAWAVTPVSGPGTAPATGLPRAAMAPLPGALQAFASNRPLTAERWSVLERRLEVRAGDTLPVAFRARRDKDPSAPGVFTLELSAPLGAGSALELRLRPGDADTSFRVLFSGRAPDSSQLGGLRLLPPAARRDWTFWLRQAAGENPGEHPLRRSGDTLKTGPVPAGRYRLLAFRDRDGDGAWHPGALKPWIPQEPFETVLDTVTVTPGAAVDVTERLAP